MVFKLARTELSLKLNEQRRQKLMAVVEVCQKTTTTHSDPLQTRSVSKWKGQENTSWPEHVQNVQIFSSSAVFLFAVVLFLVRIYRKEIHF